MVEVVTVKLADKGFGLLAFLVPTVAPRLHPDAVDPVVQVDVWEPVCFSLKLCAVDPLHNACNSWVSPVGLVQVWVDQSNPDVTRGLA